jgi:hypothetical protein
MMKRLTKRILDHVYYTGGAYPETLPAECMPWDVRTILKQLSAYEDTNLTPAEVPDLARAKEEGRLVVLPEGLMSDQYIGLLKSISAMVEPIYKRAAEAEKERLEYGET